MGYATLYPITGMANMERKLPRLYKKTDNNPVQIDSLKWRAGIDLEKIEWIQYIIGELTEIQYQMKAKTIFPVYFLKRNVKALIWSHQLTQLW